MSMRSKAPIVKEKDRVKRARTTNMMRGMMISIKIFLNIFKQYMH
jgi:hypothetical protein